MVSVSTVQPSLNQEFLCTLSLKCLCTLEMKKRNDKKNPVDPQPLYDILGGLKALCDS